MTGVALKRQTANGPARLWVIVHPKITHIGRLTLNSAPLQTFQVARSVSNVKHHRSVRSSSQSTRHQTEPSDMATFGNNPPKPSEFLNSGDSDASPDGVPSQFLLLRGLEPTVTEDLLAKGVAKLYKPSGLAPSSSTSKKGNAKVASTTGDANLGAKEGSIRRVLLVRDRRSNESWRYGFAEFASVDVSFYPVPLVA